MGQAQAAPRTPGRYPRRRVDAAWRGRARRGERRSAPHAPTPPLFKLRNFGMVPNTESIRLATTWSGGCSHNSDQNRAWLGEGGPKSDNAQRYRRGDEETGGKLYGRAPSPVSPPIYSLNCAVLVF